MVTARFCSSGNSWTVQLTGGVELAIAPENTEAAPARWDWPRGGEIRLGSQAHKELFCRFLLDTYDPYKPAVIPWPKMEGAALARLTGLPFWQLAVEIENATSKRMQTMAEQTDDPLIREALELNAFEERRHRDVLQNMIRFYGIEIGDVPEYPRPERAEWEYIRCGYGECFDSFFAFGLFELAKSSGFFPPELVEVFEPVIQEEARHILFFANWLAYENANRSFINLPWFAARRAGAIWLRAYGRVKLAMSARTEDVTTKGHAAMGIQISPRGFVELCLAENERRMARYDARLARPRIMPALARAGLLFIRD